MWQGIAVHDGGRGPLLEGALGWLECALAGECPAGDHTFFVGEVEVVEAGAQRPALMRYGGEYRSA
jgi:flavin reductase (DIM6/NTAB) family NADH-FMN oxidoreductase RutF